MHGELRVLGHLQQCELEQVGGSGVLVQGRRTPSVQDVRFKFVGEQSAVPLGYPRCRRLYPRRRPEEERRVCLGE